MGLNKNKIKKQLITELESVPIPDYASEKAGVSRATYYRWRKEDSDFKEKTEEALILGRSTVSQLAESRMIQRIDLGEKWAIVYWLNNNEPRYMKIDKVEKLKEKEPTHTLVHFIGDEDDEGVVYDSFNEYIEAERLKKGFSDITNDEYISNYGSSKSDIPVIDSIYQNYSERD